MVINKDIVQVNGLLEAEPHINVSNINSVDNYHTSRRLTKGSANTFKESRLLKSLQPPNPSPTSKSIKTLKGLRI